MNFLAHCLLGHPDPGLVAGGFIGDFIKGRVPEDIPVELQRGVRLHRRIDSISNLMPEMRASYAHFGPELRRVAPVLLDIVADHLLAIHWDRFGEGSLAEFTAVCYATIDRYDVPPRGRRFFAHMRTTDLLARYTDAQVVERAMASVLDRLRHGHLRHHLEPVLGGEPDRFLNDFEVYFPLLTAAVDSYLDGEPGLAPTGS